MKDWTITRAKPYKPAGPPPGGWTPEQLVVLHELQAQGRLKLTGCDCPECLPVPEPDPR